MWKDKKYFLVEDFNEKETIDLMNCYIGLRRSNLKNVSEMIENDIVIHVIIDKY